MTTTSIATIPAQQPATLPWCPTPTYALPGNPGDVYVIPVSGGADSTVLAIILRELFPDTQFHLIFADTGAEPLDLYESMDRLEGYIGQKIERIDDGDTLWTMIDKWNGFLPSPKDRSCTPYLKLKPFKRWMTQFSGRQIHSFIGIRADESQRLAFALEGVETHMPFIDLGLKRKDIFQRLRETVGVPFFYKYKSRSGCLPCPFMRRQELVGTLQMRPRGFEQGEEYEKLSPQDLARHDAAPDLTVEVGIAQNWLGYPRPRSVRDLGKVGNKKETIFETVGIWIAAEFFFEVPLGGQPFDWSRRLISFSTSLGGIKRQINTRFEHLLSTAEVHDMDEWDVRNRVDFAIYYIEADASVFDPEGPGPASFTWHAGQSYRQIRHIMSWAERVLTSEELHRQAARLERHGATSWAWEQCSISKKATQKIRQPTGRLLAMTLYEAQEPTIEETLDPKHIACPMCSL